MNKTFCDFCGKEWDKNLDMKRYYQIREYITGTMTCYDMCRKCFDELKKKENNPE